MAERFNLTAQLQLQAPTNVRQVVGDIRRQLSGLAVNVQVKGNTRALAQVNKQMQSVSKSAGSASKNVNNLSRNLSEAARRFSVITVATGTMLALARSIKDGVGEAIAFERELVRISQVTGKTTSQLKGLTQEVTRLATGLGASSKDLLNVSRTLAQAGFSAEKTKQALDILAKTSLAATFDTIQDTTEGAIAVLRQFRKEARQAGGDVKFLEKTMDAINSVSKNFAVESGDLITVIRRVGGVFEAAGGSVNELIALFTSVRATTRESAETISTGLRTIFTRIQRTDTVDQLKQLGIELRNSQGQFVGAFEAVRRLSAGLSSLDPRDYRFSEIVESLGGFRQIGKVIPLIRQFRTAQEALNVAQASSGSVARDAAIAQQSLAVQAGKVAQEFRALMRTFADSSTFKSVANGALEIARAMIRVAEALEPVLPMLGILAGLKIGQGVAPLLGGLLAGGRRGGRGSVSKFASGGYVPGSGNRDTVPAMLTPGEFVIKKSSAKKLGPATLSAMNNNRFATGGQVGIVALKPYDPDAPNPLTLTSTVSRADVARKVYGKEGQGAQLGRDLEGKSLGADPIGNALRQFVSKGGISVDATGSALGDAALGTDLERVITDNFVDSINIGAKRLEEAFENKVTAKEIKYADAGRLGIESVVGNAFEGIIASLRGAVFSSKDKNNANFDFVKGIGIKLAELLRNPALGAIPTDAKRTLSNRQLEEAVTKKYKNQLADAARDLGIGKGPAAQSRTFNKDQLQQKALGVISERSGSKKNYVTLTEMQKEFKGVKASDLIDAGFRKGFRRQYIPPGLNSGGQVDSVPALLTPGEFVINKKSAQSIGYGNLHSMNKTGVARFNAGGAVDGVQKFQNGGRSFASRRRMVERRRFVSGVRSNLSALDPVANAAQSFVFAGSAAAALASQFSGLSNETKQAITETAGYASTIVGLGGTVGQIFTSIATSGIAQAASSDAVTASNTRQSAAANAATTTLVSIGAAVAITTVALKYLEASAKASADAAFKRRDAIIKEISEGGSGLGAAQATIDGRVARAKEELAASSNNVGMAAGAVGTALAAVVIQSTGAAAAMGSFAGPAGIAVGAIIGIGVGLGVYYSQQEAVTEATKRQTAAIQENIAAIVRLAGSAYTFDRALREIDQANLDPETRLERRQQARDQFRRSQRTDRFGADADTRAARQQMGSAIGRFGLGVSADSFARAGENVAADQFALNEKILRQEQQNLEASLKSARENLREAEKLPGIFDEGSKNAAIYAKAVEDVSQALRENQERIDKTAFEEQEGARRFAQSPESRGGVITTEAEKREIDSIERNRQEQENITNRAISDLNAGSAQLEITTNELREAQLKAAKAADEFRQRLDRARAFGAALATEEARLQSFGQSLDNTIAILNNTSVNLSNPVSGLENLTEIEHLDKFTTDLNRVVAGLPARMQAAGFEAVEAVSVTAKLLTEGRKNVLDAFGPGVVDKIGPKTVNPDEIIAAAGFTEAFNKLGGDMQGIIRSRIEKAATDGITSKEFDEIFAEVIKENDYYVEQLKRSNQLINKENQLRLKLFEQQQNIEQRRIDAEAKAASVSAKNAELLAKARGEELSSAQKEARRTQQAQINLRGTGLRAGDVAGARDLIIANRAQRKSIVEDINKRGGKATDDELKRLASLTSETERASKELARLGDQSERASDILSDLDKERAKQDAAIGILQDFVTGGVDQRRAMLTDAAAVNMAIRTGTIQNQSEDQRSRTFALLDRLKDIELVQDPRFGAMTGSDVKKFLTVMDSVRLGLLTQEQAFNALNKPTKEQELINALKDLTKVIDQAAGAEVDIANANVAGVPLTLPSRRFGGRINGRSHASGGVPIEAEGGEYIIRKESVAKYGEKKLNSVNNGTAAIYMKYGGGIPKAERGMFVRPKFQGGGGTSPPSLAKQLLERERLLKAENDLHFKEIQRLKKIHGVSNADAISTLYKGRMRTAALEGQVPGGRQSFVRKGFSAVDPAIKNFGRVANKVMGKLDLVGTTAEVMTSDYVRPGVEGAGGVLTAQGIGTASILKSLFTGTDITKGLAESAVASERRGRDAGSVNRGQGGFITGSSYAKVLNPDEVIGTGATTQTGTLNAAAVFSEFFLGGGSGASGPTNIKELLAQQAGPSEAVPFKDVKDLNRTLAGMTGPIDALKNAFLAGEITQKQFTDTLKTHETKVFRRLNVSEGSLKQQRAAVSDRIRSKFSSDQTISQKAAAEQKAGEKRQAESRKRRMGEETASGMVLTEDGYRYPDDADRQKRLEDEMAQSRRDFAASDEGKKFFEEQRKKRQEADAKFQAFKNRGAPDLGPRTAPKPQRGVFREKRPDFIPAPPKEKTPETAYDPKTGGIKIKTAGQIPLSTPSVARSGFKLSEQEKSQRERAQRINEIRTREKAEREKKRKDRIAAGGPKGLTRSESDELDPLGRRILGESGATVDDAAGRPNLSRDFDKKQFEASRQAARDRIAAKEEARRDAAATRAANRAAESPEDKARRQKSNRWIRQSERQARIELGTAKGPAIEARKRVEARKAAQAAAPAAPVPAAPTSAAPVPPQVDEQAKYNAKMVGLMKEYEEETGKSATDRMLFDKTGLGQQPESMGFANWLGERGMGPNMGAGSEEDKKFQSFWTERQARAKKIDPNYFTRRPGLNTSVKKQRKTMGQVDESFITDAKTERKVVDPYWEYYDKVDQGKAGGTPASRAAERVRQKRGDITGRTPAERARQRQQQKRASAVQKEEYGTSGSAVQGRVEAINAQREAIGAQFQQQQQPGMRRGGFIGQNNVQAASAGGGGLSIDPSQLQVVMSRFVQEFSNALNNMTNPIKTVANTLSGLASAMQNLTLNVEFSGEAQMSLYIENIGDIKAKLTEHVTSEIERLVVKSSQADKPASKEVNPTGD